MCLYSFWDSNLLWLLFAGLQYWSMEHVRGVSLIIYTNLITKIKLR